MKREQAMIRAVADKIGLHQQPGGRRATGNRATPHQRTVGHSWDFPLVASTNPQFTADPFDERPSRLFKIFLVIWNLSRRRFVALATACADRA
jgi:hypothetical protein